MSADKTDLLAAVVLHCLVTEDVRTFKPICEAVERDPAKPDDHEEVERALAVLIRDDLAAQEGEQWIPTRAATRAYRLLESI